MWDLYWITRLDGLHDFFYTLFVITTVLGGASMIGWTIASLVGLGDCYSEEAKAGLKTLLKTSVCICVTAIFTSLASIFIPTTKEACMIYLGGNVVEYVRGNDQLKEMPDKVVNLADQYLDELIKQKDDHAN